MQALDITADAFHPEWNYTIKPRRRQMRGRCPAHQAPGTQAKV
jgi:hypothetical protein